MKPAEAFAELQRLMSAPPPSVAIWNTLPVRTRELILAMVRAGGTRGMSTGNADELSTAELGACWMMIRELADRCGSAVRQRDLYDQQMLDGLQTAMNESQGRAA